MWTALRDLDAGRRMVGITERGGDRLRVLGSGFGKGNKESLLTVSKKDAYNAQGTVSPRHRIAESGS